LTKPPEPPPEFFVDRSLGRHIVPDAIRALGFTVHAMADVYPEGDDQRVSDTQWIAEADERGWVVLTKDERITRRADEQEALTNSRLRVFAIGNQHLTGPTMATYYKANIHRMVQRARKPGPFVDIVYPGRVERRWPR
jgi:PIN like domain